MAEGTNAHPAPRFYLYRLFGVGGALLIVLGLFCPARLGGFGFLDPYISVGPNSYLVTILTLYTIVLVMTLRRGAALIFGCLTLALVLYDYVSALDAHRSQAIFTSAASVGWGWTVLIVGCLVLIAAAVFYDPEWNDTTRIHRVREWCAVIATTFVLLVTAIYAVTTSQLTPLWAIVALAAEFLVVYFAIAGIELDLPGSPLHRGHHPPVSPAEAPPEP